MPNEASKVANNRGQFEKGRAKTGGRQKGTPNKKTAEFKQVLGDFDTVREMVKLFYTTEKDDLKVAICKEFLKYEYPQRKAIELAQEVELPVINIKGI